MNPAKFQRDDNRPAQHSSVRRDQMMINGNRPSPLKINRGSHIIHKPPNSYSRMGAANKSEEQHHHQKRQPVIIYTQSPKIIHTQARDFMALVQKLTGLSRSDNIHDGVHGQTLDTDTTHEDHAKVKVSSCQDDHIDNPDIAKSAVSRSHDGNESCSDLTDEINCGGGNYDNNSMINSVHHQVGSSSSSGYSPNAMFSNPSPYFADIPLFTPTANNSADFFCPPRPLYRFSDSSSSPNVGGSMSPSMFKFIKGLPEY
ncbi:hypothetical protein D8674_015933 [Pyrus ussuriensis x Pyrus communis]|uniref:VQ domain-containing protein n=1 Tax=Pyrus ussuriensis x Pyrus communis TaxID=2448454 RepID=A0A5N5HCG5_9ROSA|nr:hypothetical protein D8674_015933 [Pyrus ussuriensis x Pyrus communis]